MPTEWGQAKIEILALRDEILAKIEQGILVRTIYEDLSASGRVTMSRRSFYDRVKQLRSSAAKSSRRSAANQPFRQNSQNRQSHAANVHPTHTNTLPTLKAEEQAEFNRLWDAPSDDGENAE
ncbi:MAG: TraK family protein [Thalassospira sp.]|uniref:hypothetical protein n=1 Tax=Thalassospira sp. TaxID=1912094 RepID=UPI0032EE7389